ncbi:lipoprotein [Salinicoccus halodurans]|uniref:Lipoprotein n=1 Tax=Salinicoccus halodurans TaxID=407035 RepID=A0A0F7HL69_9STAP|nr:lipoprotein [Salinicoccus halodurans]AKG74284.1 hypothetical protein AAT16_08600 [Salinicoccus halodurans]SFK93991.1 hypothetical protein SAMN05216235_2617 [Salinicoccus halodurans]
MKKIFPILLIVFFVTGCQAADNEELDELYSAFERNQSEIEADFQNYYEEIESSDNRETQLKIIYEEMIPAIEDFKTTIQNYDVTAEDHKALKEDMLAYISSLHELTGQIGEFNRTFIAGNPFDEGFTEDADKVLEAVRKKEEQVQQAYEKVLDEYENLTAE